ncbi:MAG: alpha/beta hydrolase [Marinoscillum sp.]
MKHILFLQGGGGQEDYKADAKLVASLREHLPDNYSIHYPVLKDDSSPDFGRMKQIQQEIAIIAEKMILVAHSLGASMLLKYLSEHEVVNEISGVFLLATPYWSGDEDWVKGLMLQEDFASSMVRVPTFLYHCLDDEIVPFDHFTRYQQKLPTATFRTMPSGGHQFNNDLQLVAKDILTL